MSRGLRFTALVLLVAALLSGGMAAAGAQSFSGTIASGPQYDIYSIALTAGEQVSATLSCVPVPGTLDTVLSVFLPNVDYSTTANAAYYNDDGGPNSCGFFRSSAISFTAPVTGIYAFRVDGFGSSTGDYLLYIDVAGFSNPIAADGRINAQADAPIVLYCNAGATDFFSVTGTFQGTVANGGSATFGGAVVRPTADGRMEVSAGLPDGKTYLFIWEGCDSGHYEVYSVSASGVPTLYDSGTYD